MRLVAALGGNALLRRGEAMSAANQWANVRRAATPLAALVKAGHQLVITHGNGPQIGLLALQAEAGPQDGAYPLDVLDAESEGMIGYMIEQELRNHLPPGARVATLLTQVLVDAADPAFGKPDKPIGQVYDEAEARRLGAARGWTVAVDGRGWRRVVPSPMPLEILQQPVVELLIEAGVTVICTGGGGVPCTRRPDRMLAGVEAVVDKDRASALLATGIGADMLMLLTDVDAAYVGFGTPRAQRISRANPRSLQARKSEFRAGSMGPKIEGAIRFALASGHAAGIGRLEDAVEILQGNVGTIVESAADGLQFRT
jgi:carbamate kinase